MASENKKKSLDRGAWVIGGILCGICILLGIVIAWIGWWTVLIALLIMLYAWDWRWALVITLAFLWIWMDLSLLL